MEVAVIGTGFWGTFIGEALQNAGLAVGWIDGRLQGAASPVAAGLVWQSSWARSPAPWWSLEHEECSRRYFQAQGDRVVEEVYSEFRPQPMPRGVLWRCRPRLARGEPLKIRQLLATPGGWKLEWEGGSRRVARVVVAAGCWSSQLLQASGIKAPSVQAWAGRALLAPGSHSGVLSRCFRLAGDSRSRKFSLQSWDPGLIRLGDTLERPGDVTVPDQTRLLHQCLPEELPRTEIFGLRPWLSQIWVEEMAPGLILATGGARRGLALAPGVALRVLQLWSSRRTT